MSDISIPGVTSKYNTDKMIEALVKAESIPLDRMKAEQKTLQANKKEWQNVNRLMTTLRSSARLLYSFENPFAERTASSPDAGISATATREAVEGTTRLQVIQLAQADRFGSKPLTKDYPVPDGNYSFQIGDETIRLRFRGGTAKEFADALTRQGDGKIKGAIIQNRPDSQILLIESLKTGAAWPLQFKDDALKLGLDLGMITEDKGKEARLPLTRDQAAAWTKPLADVKGQILSTGEILTVQAGGELSLPVPADFRIAENMVLEYQLRAKSRSLSDWKPPAKPEGPLLNPGPGASLKDVSLPDLEMPVTLPDWQSPKAPEIVTDSRMLFALRGNQSVDLPEVADSADFQTVTVPIGRQAPDMTALGIRNANTLRDLEIKGVRIYDPAVRGNYKPLNPVSNAQDSQVRLEGIDLYRDTNVLKDAIPGVTLTLNATTEKPVPVKVEPDRKLVKDKLIEYVANYNAVLREINIVTARADTADIVAEVDFWDDKQKEEAMKRLGMFQGDTTLAMIKSRLQSISSNPYRTADGQSLSLLAQAGISTNASQGGGVNTAKLRGYLEIDEKTLDRAMAEHFLALRDLFGSDTNGDKLPDTGAGVEIDKYIQPYVQIGGILAAKDSAVDTQIKAKDKEIKDYQAHITDYQADLKNKYGKMEASVNQMQQSIKSIQSLNNSNNQ
jgi:flagellar hook-associated protein 2